ncbi:transferrin-binding protein-like solute binding protein [Pseudorhodobacter sp.]|uniref:transferrin-binding protein-like solute binding protein n=1 Tax=Pseudorhodobacter sp. TaxID=1934400 RepID=UPI0026484CC3|nr:transferrin-binding protein-like solute binding protein [Pseudorhodobacter sp.]MDN5788246.1 transferrin-binding protein-like solute binding protein [Pseudorhodobacter sp.]
MTIKTTALISTALLATLAACGGGGGGQLGGPIEITPAEEGTRSFAAKADGSTQDAGGALSAGSTLTARKVAAVGQLLNYNNGKTGATDAAVSIKKNAQGGHDVTINGKVMKFTAADRLVEADGTFGYNIEDDAKGVYSSVFNYTGDLDDLLNPGHGYAEVLSIQTNKLGADNADTAAFAVVGTETADAALKGMPTATYKGNARLNVTPNTGFVDNGTSRIKVRSAMTMTADFGKGEVSGKLTGITAQQPGSAARESLPGSVLLNTAKFNNNGFKGSVSADAAFADNSGLTVGSGTYGGAFYGPAANEVAGGLTFTGTAEGGTALNGIGYFQGGKQ